jgi:acetyl esterase/lipase
MRRVYLLLLAFAALLGSPLVAATPAAEPTTAQSNAPIRLWDQSAPGALSDQAVDIPTLTPFLIANKTKPAPAFIVCPGGSYQHLADHEGAPVAQWFTTLGIDGFVLKYRLGPKYHHPVEMEDVQRAIRLIRANASRWNIDPKRIGIIGFSAGGHLASTAATHFEDGNASAADPIERVSSRPDLVILMYPVITMMDPYVHAGSRLNLLGKTPEPSLIALLSNERQVTPATPPCFIVQGADDHIVQVQNSLMFAAACRENKVPFELHIFEHGRHGFGLGGTDPVLSTWPALAATWLRGHGFVNQ